MARTLDEIANDIDRAERAIVKGTNKAAKAAMIAAGKPVDDDVFDDGSVLQITADGTDLSLADLANELRAIARQAKPEG